METIIMILFVFNIICVLISAAIVIDVYREKDVEWQMTWTKGFWLFCGVANIVAIVMRIMCWLN